MFLFYMITSAAASPQGRKGKRMDRNFKLPSELDELANLKQWVCYNIGERNGKQTKIPIDATTGKWAQTNNPETWHTLPHTLEAAQKNGYSGVGFVFGNGYAGIDIDHCIDDAGNLNDMGASVIDLLDSYTEYSPSGRGLHIIIKTDLPPIGRKDDEIGLEMYNHSRYFTVTGRPYGTPQPIQERTKQAQELLNRYFQSSEASPKTSATQPTQVQQPRAIKPGGLRKTEFDAAKLEVKTRWRELIKQITTEAKQGQNGEMSYICPICGHGKGGDGLTYYPTSNSYALHCFGSCGFTGDIIALYMEVQKVDFRTAVVELAAKIGIDVIGAQGRRNDTGADESATLTADYTEYYKKCHVNLKEQSLGAPAWQYIRGRKILPATILKYGIGFDEQADPCNAPGGDTPLIHPTPRIIIPINKESYFGRRIDGIKDFDKAWAKGSPVGVWNASALYGESNNEPVFVCEGVFDALSVIETGGVAVAINSANNVKILLDMLSEKPTHKLIIIALDADESGIKATMKLKSGLDKLRVPNIIAEICGDEKDLNDAFVSDRETFVKNIENVSEAAVKTLNKPDDISAYIMDSKNGMDFDISKYQKFVRTGFQNLDARSLGLFGGLYVLAATSSLGKTTFTHQLADQLAQQGNDVIFFSLEQSRLELVAKSITRQLAIMDSSSKLSNLSIRMGANSLQVIEAKKKYVESIGNRLSIIQSGFECTPSYIRQYVDGYSKRNNTRPIVIIDYLQAVQPDKDEKSYSKKDDMDKVIIELKKISSDLSLPIIAVSSVNRANYLTPVDFESIKESGGIEYTADVIWGLQLQVLNSKEYTDYGQQHIVKKREAVKNAKKEIPRKIELVCLKNRFGISSYSCFFNYYPNVDLYEIDEKSEKDQKPDEINDDNLKKQLEEWDKHSDEILAAGRERRLKNQ